MNRVSKMLKSVYPDKHYMTWTIFLNHHKIVFTCDYSAPKEESHELDSSPCPVYFDPHGEFKSIEIHACEYYEINHLNLDEWLGKSMFHQVKRIVINHGNETWILEPALILRHTHCTIQKDVKCEVTRSENHD